MVDSINSVCVLCGAPVVGKPRAAGDHPASATWEGMACSRCGAAVCLAHKEELGWRRWSGYAKSPCPGCGTRLKGYLTIVRDVAAEFTGDETSEATTEMIERLFAPGTSLDLMDRPKVAGELAATGETAALRALARMLCDPPDSVTNTEFRIAYADAISRFDQVEAGEALSSAALNDEDAKVRLHCLNLLSSYSAEPEVFDLLASSLHDPSERVRCVAANALARATDPRGVQHLVQELRTGLDVSVAGARGRPYLDYLLEGATDRVDWASSLAARLGPNDIRFVLVSHSLAQGYAGPGHPDLVVGLADRLLILEQPRSSGPALGIQLWGVSPRLTEVPISGLKPSSVRWHKTSVTLNSHNFELHVVGGCLAEEQWRYFLDEMVPATVG